MAEHHARRGELPPTHQVLREGLGQDVLDAADDARIAVLPYQVGQHAYYTISVGVQLLHFRHGGRGVEVLRLRDQTQTALMDLRQDLAGWALGHPADGEITPPIPHAQTVRRLPVRVPRQRRIGA